MLPGAPKGRTSLLVLSQKRDVPQSQLRNAKKKNSRPPAKRTCRPREGRDGMGNIQAQRRIWISQCIILEMLRVVMGEEPQRVKALAEKEKDCKGH